MHIEMPVTLKMGELMDEDKFFRFCQMNDTLKFERDSDGNIIMMSPAGSFTKSFNSHISGHLFSWNESTGSGEVFASIAGFTLPNGAVRSPDVSWIKKEKWASLRQTDKEKFAPVCPDFVVEIRSEPDDVRYLQDKMGEYIDNGTQLGWLIDRLDNKVYIYSSRRTMFVHDTLDLKLSGDEVLPGFELNPCTIIQ